MYKSALLYSYQRKATISSAATITTIRPPIVSPFPPFIIITSSIKFNLFLLYFYAQEGKDYQCNQYGYTEHT